MSAVLSKLCADHLRASCSPHLSSKIKASHARELVAAYFGYKSHSALLAEKSYPLENLGEAVILVPDIPLIDQRRARLENLPEDMPSSRDLAELLSSFLQEEGYFGGDVWLYDSLETYVMEVLLIDADPMISDELSGRMAETNALFSEFPYYEGAEIKDSKDSIEIMVSGSLQGTPLDDKPFCGDTIDLEVQVSLPRIAGKRGFLDFEINVGGSVNDDWVDPELKYGTPNLRPKEQFLEMTGGFRFGESQGLFIKRQDEIKSIRNRLEQGEASARDVARLSHLLGANDEFDDLL